MVGFLYLDHSFLLVCIHFIALSLWLAHNHYQLFNVHFLLLLLLAMLLLPMLLVFVNPANSKRIEATNFGSLCNNRSHWEIGNQSCTLKEHFWCALKIASENIVHTHLAFDSRWSQCQSQCWSRSWSSAFKKQIKSLLCWACEMKWNVGWRTNMHIEKYKSNGSLLPNVDVSNK